MNEEIDLIELLLKFVIFIKTKIKTILIAVFIGCFIGIFTFYIQPEKYLYKITGYSPYIKNNVIKNSISEFSAELKNNRDEFCQKYNLDVNIFQNIKSITISENKNNKKDLEILIQTTTPICIDSISLSIEKYISMNSFISKKIATRYNQLEGIISFLDIQIQKIDNRETLNLKENENGYYENSAALLYIDKNKYEAELVFLKPMIFTNHSIPQNTKHGIIIFLVSASAIAIFLIFIFYFMRKINGMTNQLHVIKSSVKHIRESA